MRWIGFGVAALAGCGRIDFAELHRADAPPIDGSCTFGPWGTPQLLAALSSPKTDYGGEITGDGLALYFDSSRTGTNDLYVATRTSTDAAFGAPVAEPVLDADAFSGDQSPTGDQLELYFDSDRGTEPCIYVTTRTSAATAWTTPHELALCAEQEAVGPYVTPDGLALYYNIALDTPTEGVLYVASRASRDDEFPPGAPLGISTGANSGFPALSADQLTIYFESETGPGGTLELWQASRAGLADAFGAPSRIPDIANPSGDNSDVSITADGLALYFASNRQTGLGGDDLYVATRSCD
ncbi:MAG TPA: hypothetical protein VLX92_17185 [Kofleriaceae bacterium]|nr:hypothetical protein [Kofleriaceae bacterium]